ncbi:unnamed protein product [Brassica oleracea var. botrytis]
MSFEGKVYGDMGLGHGGGERLQLLTTHHLSVPLALRVLHHFLLQISLRMFTRIITINFFISFISHVLKKSKGRLEEIEIPECTNNYHFYIIFLCCFS